MEKLFPVIQIVVAAAAAVMYVAAGDWKRVLYWGAAALITVSVTI